MGILKRQSPLARALWGYLLARKNYPFVCKRRVTHEGHNDSTSTLRQYVFFYSRSSVVLVIYIL